MVNKNINGIAEIKVMGSWNSSCMKYQFFSLYYNRTSELYKYTDTNVYQIFCNRYFL